MSGAARSVTPARGRSAVVREGGLVPGGHLDAHSPGSAALEQPLGSLPIGDAARCQETDLPGWSRKRRSSCREEATVRRWCHACSPELPARPAPDPGIDSDAPPAAADSPRAAPARHNRCKRRTRSRQPGPGGRASPAGHLTVAISMRPHTHPPHHTPSRGAVLKYVLAELLRPTSHGARSWVTLTGLRARWKY